MSYLIDSATRDLAELKEKRLKDPIRSGLVELGYLQGVTESALKLAERLLDALKEAEVAGPLVDNCVWCGVELEGVRCPECGHREGDEDCECRACQQVDPRGTFVELGDTIPEKK